VVRCFRGEGTRDIVPLVDEDPNNGGKLTPKLQYIRHPHLDLVRALIDYAFTYGDGRWQMVDPPRPRARLRVARTR